MERYLPTGNEQISIPRLNEVTAAIEDITFLYMACRGPAGSARRQSTAPDAAFCGGGRHAPTAAGPVLAAGGILGPGVHRRCRAVWRRGRGAGPGGRTGLRLEAAGHQPGCLPS